MFRLICPASMIFLKIVIAFLQATENCSEASTLCQNTGGSYFCECLHGFKPLNPTWTDDYIMRNQVACADIDECEDFPEVQKRVVRIVSLAGCPLRLHIKAGMRQGRHVLQCARKFFLFMQYWFWTCWHGWRWETMWSIKKRVETSTIFRSIHLQ